MKYQNVKINMMGLFLILFFAGCAKSAKEPEKPVDSSSVSENSHVPAATEETAAVEEVESSSGDMLGDILHQILDGFVRVGEKVGSGIIEAISEDPEARKKLIKTIKQNPDAVEAIKKIASGEEEIDPEFLQEHFPELMKTEDEAGVIKQDTHVAAATEEEKSVNFSMLTQNLYLGADTEPLIKGTLPSELLERIKSTNFSERAEGLAISMTSDGTEDGVGKFAPDVIALQEVVTVWTTDADGKKTEVLNFLKNLKDSLREISGAEYKSLVSQATQLEISDCVAKCDKITFNLDNVVLVKEGIEVESWESHSYAKENQFALQIWPGESHFTHILGNSSIMMGVKLTEKDIKNGGTLLKFTRTVGIAVLKKNGIHFTVVNTHLQDENQQGDRKRQAIELLSYLKEEKYLSNPEVPVFLLGDLNSPKLDKTTSSSQTLAFGGAPTSLRAYDVLQEGGFVDLVSDPDTEVSTCCREENLIGDGSMSDGQIDNIMHFSGHKGSSTDTHTALSVLSVQFLGDQEQDKVEVNGKLRWPSDHLGIRVEVKLQ